MTEPLDWRTELMRRLEAAMPAPDGRARQAQWVAEDGWIVGYTTTRIAGGPYDGDFASFGYRPVGRGSRSGTATRYERVTFTRASTRRTAKARALRLYAAHSPRWAEKGGGR